MASKEYEVLKTVKIKGEEHGPGAVVKLEPHQADRLNGLFVKDYTAPVESKAAAKTGGKGKGTSDTDGL